MSDSSSRTDSAATSVPVYGLNKFCEDWQYHRVTMNGSRQLPHTMETIVHPTVLKGKNSRQDTIVSVDFHRVFNAVVGEEDGVPTGDQSFEPILWTLYERELQKRGKSATAKRSDQTAEEWFHIHMHEALDEMSSTYTLRDPKDETPLTFGLEDYIGHFIYERKLEESELGAEGSIFYICDFPKGQKPLTEIQAGGEKLKQL